MCDVRSSALQKCCSAASWWRARWTARTPESQARLIPLASLHVIIAEHPRSPRCLDTLSNPNPGVTTSIEHAVTRYLEALGIISHIAIHRIILRGNIKFWTKFYFFPSHDRKRVKINAMATACKGEGGRPRICQSQGLSSSNSHQQSGARPFTDRRQPTNSSPVITASLPEQTTTSIPEN